MPASAEDDAIAAVAEQGWRLLPGLLPASRCAAAAHAATGAGAGTRRALETLELHALACDVRLRGIAARLLGGPARLIRALCFDKHAARNWRVPWHQDLAVALAERHDREGFAAWSVKDGVPHAHPPVELSRRRVALRVHLDDVGADNAPLRMLPGSHRLGPLDAAAVAAAVAAGRAVACLAARGDVLAMHPLLLHASEPARVATHRRVLHLEFSDREPPCPLRWALADPAA